MQNARSLLVVGRTGQLARALVAVANERNLPLIAVARPELDLSDAESIDRIVNAHLSPGDRKCCRVHTCRQGRIGSQIWLSRSIATVLRILREWRSGCTFPLSTCQRIMCSMVTRRRRTRG